MLKNEKLAFSKRIKSHGFVYEKYSEMFLKKLNEDVYCYVSSCNINENYIDFSCGVTSVLVGNLIIECFKTRFREFVPLNAMEKTFPIIYTEIERYLPQLSVYTDVKRINKVNYEEQEFIADVIADNFTNIFSRYTDLFEAAREGEATLKANQTQAFGVFFSYISLGKKEDAIRFASNLNPMIARWDKYIIEYEMDYKISERYLRI